MSQDSQATDIVEDDMFNPIRLIVCATLIERIRRINRRMGIFSYEGKGNTAFYQGSGTSGAPALKGTYLPFYGETNKLLKAVDVFPSQQSKDWKISLRNDHNIKIDHAVLDYFRRFEDLQISASINSSFWNGLSYRVFILSHEWNETTGEFVPFPNGQTIPYSNNFSEMDCVKRLEMERGQINDFLRASGARIGEGQIEAYLELQQENQQQENQQQEKRQREYTEVKKGIKKRKSTTEKKKIPQVIQNTLEEKNLPPGEGGKRLKNRNIPKKSKKTKKRRKPRNHKKSKKNYSINN